MSFFLLRDRLVPYMIGSLRGTVIEIGPAHLLVEVAGMGYRVAATPATVSLFRMGEEAFVYTHDHIREESRDLYGFPTPEDLRLFERMIAISGVGPKVALSLLAVGSAETVRRAIMNGDLALLTSIPGVGKKIAQKIILELKGKIVEEGDATGPDREVVEALVSLGYSGAQAREALKSVPADIADVSDRVREALRMLSS